MTNKQSANEMITQLRDLINLNNDMDNVKQEGVTNLMRGYDHKHMAEAVSEEPFPIWIHILI